MSNCVAGWWLGGAGHPDKLPRLLIAATCLYVGGMFLNDFFDAPFDALHRPERPIPSGRLTRRAVGIWGAAWLAIGWFLALTLGKLTAALGLLLLVCILSYDWLHKKTSLAPLLMCACRLLLYPLAASIAVKGISGLVLWSGLALAFYIAGLSFLARRESTTGDYDYWPLVLLFAPVLLALIVDTGSYRDSGLLLSAIVVLWILRCSRFLFHPPSRSIGNAVTGLLAGIALVDWAAVADAPREFGALFICLFVLTWLLQRLIPAT